MNELPNRFASSDNEYCNAAENLRYLKLNRAKGKIYMVHNNEKEDYDKNSLTKYNHKNYIPVGKRNNSSVENAREITKQTITLILSRISAFLEMLSKFPFPQMSVVSFGLTSLLFIFICPRNFTEQILYPGFRITFSVIYPAYQSFKAVRNKNLKEYLKWIVYWIVYASFTCFELLTDTLMSWFPFYYEIKVITFMWLLGPSSRGAMKLYKTCIHPLLILREQVRKKLNGRDLY